MKKIFLLILVGVYCNSLAFAQEQPQINFEKVVFQDHYGYPYTETWIECILQDQRGFIWIGTQNKGLNKVKIKPEKNTITTPLSFKRYPQDPNNPQSLTEGQISGICEDLFGAIWIATFDGLNRLIKSTGAITRYQQNPNDSNSLSNNFIHPSGLEVDGQNNLWIGTEYGLNKLNPNRSQFTAFFSSSSGEIIINTKENEGTEFTVILPV